MSYILFFFAVDIHTIPTLIYYGTNLSNCTNRKC